MVGKVRITRSQLFSLSFIVLIVVLGGLFYFLFRASQSTVIQASENLREAASRELANRVTVYLNQAKEVEEGFQSEIQHEVFNPQDAAALEAALFDLILTNSNISEISFIYGKKVGYDAEGNILLAPTGRGEMSLFRTSSAISSPIDTRHLFQKEGKWVSQVRVRSSQNLLLGSPFTQENRDTVVDPTTHLTFMTPASKEFAGQGLWSDLHWSEIDKNRVEVSLQKTVTDAQGNFLGVLRVGLFEKQIDKISQFKLIPQDEHDPHIIFITNNAGELISRVNPTDTLKPIEGNLRFSPENAPPEVQLGLKEPVLRLVSDAAPMQSSRFKYEGKTYLVTYRMITGSQGWVLGIIVPQYYYVGPLEAIRNRLLLISSGIMLCLCLGAYLVQRSLKVEQQKIIRETMKMQHFEFTPTEPKSRFEDVYNILLGLELAKTAMRAMSKYVPIELVKQLYQSQKEPTLGGEIQDVSILFTDIRNFTSFAEKMPVNELAMALGDYLKVMTHIIQNKRHGVIDKYMGDGIMALWNAPTPVSHHAEVACQAVLDCSVALQELFASPKWQNLPRFETRFGLHTDKVMVGNFGAPDRLNFTAIGNGVNIASRLEGLNKLYGTSILVSENVYEAAQDHFSFRLLDIVAVKGKTEGIYVYELIAKKGEKPAMDPIISQYELAFQAYRKRHFQEAKDLLQDQLDDGPSHTLYDRCALLLQNSPSPTWDGIYISSIK